MTAGSIDTVALRAHPGDVRLLLRRVASVVCLLAFAQGAVAQCAGWVSTPEARRDCCQSGACPLHHHDHALPLAQRTQAAVDDCCARSVRVDPGLSGTVFASTMTLAALEALPPLVRGRLPLAPIGSPSETPSPPTQVPKYLLFSVLLV